SVVDRKLQQSQRSPFIDGAKRRIVPKQNSKVMSFTPRAIIQGRSRDLGGHRRGAGTEDDERCAERAQGHQNGGDRSEASVQHFEVSLLSPWHHCLASFDLAACRPHILTRSGKDAGSRSFHNSSIFRALRAGGLVIARPPW